MHNIMCERPRKKMTKILYLAIISILILSCAKPSPYYEMGRMLRQNPQMVATMDNPEAKKEAHEKCVSYGYKNGALLECTDKKYDEIRQKNADLLKGYISH